MKTSASSLRGTLVHRSLLVLLFLFSNVTLNAQSEGGDDKTLSPYFVVLSENPETDNLPLKETSAKVNIAGVIADVTVKQVYVNSGKNTLEAIYTFPLSTRAAVYAMEMTIGSRVITAKIEEKKKARDDYEEAKKAGKRTSLLEQSRPNVFTMNVANILVNDTITVELKYTEVLVPEKGQYTFVYPTVVGPRYSNKPKLTASTDDGFVSTPYTKQGIMPAYKFGIEMDIRSGIPVQSVVCPTHKTNITFPSLNAAHVTLDASESDGGNRDVVVTYSLQGNKIESGVLLYEHGDENFFLVMIQPPKKVMKEEIPPREYIFIVDVSGSMNGFPLDISKKLLRNLILNLKPDDKFNVVLFAGVAATLSPVSLDANQANIDIASRFIDAQQGSGGTELLRAIRTAYNLPRPDPDISRSFVIATDGYVIVEKETFAFIRENSGNTNFFSFGIGSSVNRYLIEGMAFMGSGEPMIVMKPDMAEGQAEKFRNYINTPVLARINVDFGSLQAYDVEPSSSPDMLAERPIIIFGKYKGKATGTVTVKGKAGRSNYKQTLDFASAVPLDENSALRYLWAREKIKLLDYNSSNEYGNDNSSGAAEILALGLKYNLMTNYTSFIAVDEQIVADKEGRLVRVKQPNPMPEGVPNSAVGFDMELSGSKGVFDRIFGGNTTGAKYKVACKPMQLHKKENAGDLNPYRGTVVESSVSEAEIVAEEPLIAAQEMPSFPSGEEAFNRFLQKNLVYPAVAKEQGISGTVYVTFIVNEDGSISDVKVLKGISAELDAEAVRVISMMPKWNFGKQDGKAVKVQMTLPINFALN